jgi:hypothetical protein
VLIEILKGICKGEYVLRYGLICDPPNHLKMNIFVSVPHNVGDSLSLRKFSLTVNRKKTITQLKRQIEKEYSELFPHEKQLICAKLEDESGYSLSNASLVEDLLGLGSRVICIPETSLVAF